MTRDLHAAATLPPGDAWQGAKQVMDESACPICLRESCESDCAHGHETPGKIADLKSCTPPRLAARHASELIDAPRPEEIIEGIATVGGLTVVVAESGTGKTFVTLDWAATVSAEMPWHGRQTLPGSVVCLSYEGDALGVRLRALRDVQGHRLEHVYVVRASDPLSPRVTREGEERSIGELDVVAVLDVLAAELAAAGKPPIVLVVIDTVRASMTGSEDSSEHVSAYLRVVRRILARLPHAAIVLVHHAGWQDGDTQRKRERGSSAWRGNVDTTLYLERGEYDRERGTCELTLRTLKTRDGEPPAPLHLIRRRVELDERDRYGRPVTTCVIERDRRTREDREAAERQATDAETRAVDLRVLAVMRDHPEATSVRSIREYAAIGEPNLRASIARILTASWATPPSRQRQPYVVTPVGLAALGETR